jgi:hypothetical protein
MVNGEFAIANPRLKIAKSKKLPIPGRHNSYFKNSSTKWLMSFTRE